MEKITKYISNNNISIATYMIFIILIALFLRIYGIANESLWYDELFSLGISTKAIVQIIESTSKDVHPPFYYILLHFWINIFNDQDTSLKLLSVLFSMTSILVLFAYLNKIYNFKIAFFSAFLLAISRLDILYSREVRMYSLLSLLVIISMFSLYLYIDKKRIRDLFIFVITTTLILYIHNFSIFLVISQILIVFILIPLNFIISENCPQLLNQSDVTIRTTIAKYCKLIYFKQIVNSFLQYLRLNNYIRNILIANIIVLLLFLPWLPILYYQVQKVSKDYWIPQISYFAFMEVIIEFCGSLYLFALFTSMAFYYLLIRRTKLLDIIAKPKYLFLFLWFIVPITIPVVISASSITSSIFKIRCLLPSMIPFLVILGIVMERIFIKSKKIFILILSLIILISANLFFSENRTLFKERWKDIAKFIDKNSNQNDVIAYDIGKEFDVLTGCEFLIKHYLKKPLVYIDINDSLSDEKLLDALSSNKNIYLIQRPTKKLKQSINSIFNRYFSKNYSQEFKICTRRYCFTDYYDNGKYNLYLEKRSEAIPVNLVKYSVAPFP